MRRLAFVAAAALLISNCGRNFDVEKALKITDVHTGWYDAGIVEGKIQGRLKPTGIRPKFVEKFEVMGIHLPPGLFGYTY